MRIGWPGLRRDARSTPAVRLRRLLDEEEEQYDSDNGQYQVGPMAMVIHALTSSRSLPFSLVFLAAPHSSPSTQTGVVGQDEEKGI